jgi:hypothetical protein
MPKKSERSPIGLNLTPELPEVVSRDFNLFYTPQKEPEVAGLKEFTSALDNFVNNGGTKATLLAEQEQKTVNSVEAEKAYNENKLAFHDAIKEGKITPDANPYYLNKYKELTLKSYANEFSDLLDRQYVEADIVNNIEAGSFDTWYKGVLTDFAKKKNISAFDALAIEKSFFTETSKARNSLENEHRQAQLKVFNTKFDEMLVNNLYGSIDDKKKDILKGTATYKDLGDVFKAQFDDIRAVNPNVNTTDLFVRTMRAYVKQTRDYDFSFKLIDNLPAFIDGGTNSIANIGKVKALKDELINELQTKKLQKVNIDNAVFDADKVAKFHGFYNDLEEKKKSNPNFLADEYLSINRDSLNAEERKAYDTFGEVYASGFNGGKESNPIIKGKIYDLVRDGDIDSLNRARELVHNSFLNKNLTLQDHTMFMTTVIPNEQKGVHKTGFSNPEFQDYMKLLDGQISGTGSLQDKKRALEIKNFITEHMLIWSNENVETYPTFTEKSKAFVKEFKDITKDLGNANIGGAKMFGLEYPTREETLARIRTAKIQQQEQQNQNQQNQQNPKKIDPSKNLRSVGTDNIVSGQQQLKQKKVDEIIAKERAKNQK